MVRQWVETSHKKIKLITLKRTKDEDTESVKSGKSGSGVMDDVIDIDLVEKQIAQDMAKTDDVLSISSSSDIVYQKPGPKCSKKPKLSDGNKSIPGNQSIPVLNKRKIPSSTNAQQTTSQLPTPSVSQQNYPVVQPSQGQIHGVVPPYQVSANYSVPPPSVHMSTSYQTQTPQYPVEGQHHPQQYPHQVPRPTLMQTQMPHCQGQASHGQGQMNPPRHNLQHQMPPQGHQTFYPNSSFSNQCTPRFPNTQIPLYSVPDNRQQYHVQSPIFSNPPPNSFTQPIQNIQPSQQQQQQLNYNHQRPPDISHPSPDLKHPSPQISGIMQAPPSISHASQSTTYMSSSTHHQPHSHPIHPSTTTSQHQASATLDSTSQLSQNSVRPSSEIRNQTQSANNLQTSPHRLHSPQIRPIVAQASFLNRPRALYPPESIPVSVQGQLPLDQSKTTSVTTVSTSSGQPSTPTSAKRPSDVADWFADKLNPKSAQESQNEQSEKILEGSTVKPKEGSLREELEKIKKNKMEEKEKPEKRKSRSRERSPISKRKKKRNDSSEYNSDIFEDSENESKRSRSSYSPSKKWSPDSRWRYNSPERRRRYSFSPRRRRSRDRSRTPSDSSIKKPDPNRKTPESRYRKSDTAVDCKSWSSGYIRRRESNSPENTRNRGSPDSDKWKRRSSNSPDYSRRRRSPDIRRLYSNSPDRSRTRISPQRRRSKSPEYRRGRQAPESYGSAKDRSLGYDFPLVRKRRSISPHRKSKSPKPQVSIPPKNSNDQSKTGANSKLSNNGKLNNTGQSLFDKEKKSEGNQNKNLLVKEVPNNSKSVMNNKPTKSQTDNNKWTKSNFTEYTVDQIHEEDKKIQEELIKLEEQKKILVAEDKKMKEEQRKQEDERIRKELKELEKQKKITEDLIKFQKQKQFEEEIERQKKLAEELIELEEQRKIAEELVELEKKKKTVKEVEELNKRKRELEKVVDKTITGIDNVEKNFLEEEIVVIEEDEINELDDLAQQKEELQKALAALENVDKESDLEDGEIEDDSEEEEEVKKEKTTVGAEKNPIVIHSIIDLTGNASRDRGSVSKDRRSVSKDRRSSSKDRRSTYSDDRQRKNSGGSDYYEDEYTHHRSSSGQSDTKRQHAKEIGNAWGAMISHSDMRVERIKGDPYFQKKKEGNEMETGKFDDTSKQKSLTAKLRSSELITAYDLDEEQQRSKNRQELVTFADWLQMEYKISDLDIYKYQKYISCVDIHSRIDENSKNKRKTLKKRLRAEMQVAQERMKLEEIEKQNAKTTPHKPTRSVVISGIKERLENEKDGGDKRIVCDSGVQLLSEIEQLQEPFGISRQQLVSELEMVRSALKMSWKTPKNKLVDTTRNEYLGFGEGDYDNEFLMRHDLQQLEAEILMRINHFEFHGVPNRRVPDILLTQKEKKLHFSQEGLFLVLTASISHKAYQNLLSLKRKLESTESLVSTLNQATHGQQIVKHLQDIEVLHQSRKAIMLTIAGFLTKKRFSKLSTRLKYYKRCMQYIQDLWKTQLVYLSTIVADVEVHLKLGERLLVSVIIDMYFLV